jgi:GNAT superfamily N-acetyltransferase
VKHLIVRRAEKQDAHGIARVCAAGWRDTYRGIKEPERIDAVISEYYTPERIRREIASPKGWDGWLVAVEGDTVIGAGGGGMTTPGVGEIFVLYLDPTRRGEGIGTLILDEITEQQRSQGAREQWVSVEPENTKDFPSTSPAASKYAANDPNGAPRRRKAMFLSGLCDDLIPSSADSSDEVRVDSHELRARHPARRRDRGRS